MAGSQRPSGTVTFLFTDIEGSTKLLHELGPERYAEALDQHRLVVRESYSRHEGVEVDTQGDAFFVAFPTVPGALEAAREAQEALAIPVRMGLHTGTPLVTGEGYVGSDVHKAARIAAAGHGRQILVSAASAALLPGDGLRDLGEHRLKDLSAPERIYQAGDGDFPRLKTLYHTNLPIPATPFLGRERELAELEQFLNREDVRLLTLLGPGGTGKTRLALQAAAAAADRFPDGVFWVPLAPLRDPGLVLESVSQAVGSSNGLAEHLADKRLLLLLDNFEHLISAAGELAPLLSSSPNLSLVVTSRELLQLAAEQSYPVSPLDPHDGVQLFVARAKAVEPGFEPDKAVPALCARLDNLPLALELAAARVRILSPRQLHERLAERLDLLKGGRDADARQQTLRATIEWSHELLDTDEQGLFADLAVFRGGCTLEAAEAVARADVDTLQSLVDKSLLRRTGERFWMLETIRTYAREQFAASADEAEVRRRHALFLIALAEAAHREMEEGGDQVVELARLDAERDNLRAAAEFVDASRADEALLRLAAALSKYWVSRGLYQEADRWLALALERGSTPIEARVRVLRAAAARTAAKGDFALSDTLTAEWLSLAEKMGNENQVLMAMNSLAMNAQERGQLETARVQFVAIKGRALEASDRVMVAFATVNLGLGAFRLGDFGAGLDYSLAAVELFRDLGDDTGVATALENCGWCSLALADGVRAAASFQEALLLAGRLGWRYGIALNGAGLGVALIHRQQEERGTILLGGASAVREELGGRLQDEQAQQAQEGAVAAARTALGEAAFAAAWARGEQLTPQELVEFARPGRRYDRFVARFLHTMVRITDPEQSRAFYEALGFAFAGDFDIVRDGQREATNYFFSLGDQERVLELTINHDGRSYELGTGYGHIAVGVEDLDGTLARLSEQGIEPERPPYSVREGGSRLCFVQDPDGYRVELIERKGT
jgi:lactoylglutathione lyase